MSLIHNVQLKWLKTPTVGTLNVVWSPLEWLYKLICDQSTGSEMTSDRNLHQQKMLAFVQLCKANTVGSIPLQVNGNCVKVTDRMK